MSIDGVAVLPRISDYVERYAHETPGKTALVCRGRRIGYRDLGEQVDAWSRALFAAGIRHGDRVAMLCTPRAEFWIAFLATTRIGAIWIGLNPRYTLRECDYVVGDAEPVLLITLAGIGGESCQRHVDHLTAGRPGLKVVCLDAPLSSATPLEDFLAGRAGCNERDYAAAVDAVDTRDPALIVYTSGSTGSPKGAVLSHYSLTFGATLQTTHFRLDEPSLVVCFPINHVASVADTCATTLVKGGKIVFLEQFDAEATIRATVDERCTMLGGVPTMYQLQMETEAWRSADFSALELLLWGGAAMPIEFIERLTALGKRLITAYGMTETATHVTYTDDGAPVEVLAHTVGRPDPHCGIRIHTENGLPSAEDNPGELYVHADFLMMCYWQREEATSAAFTDDGWLRTGDIAYVREDGNIRLVGRMSDMFKSGGYNVYPREIECAIEQHPAIAIAAVVAIPDELYQEVGVAYVRCEAGQRATPTELDEWCRTRLANYKVPKRITVLDELPLLPVGKVDKQALKHMAAGAKDAS